MPARHRKWIFDTGGAGPGAWEGGVGYALTRAALAGAFYPDVVIGSSVGAYMAANTATGNPEVFIKGWSDWGAETDPPPPLPPTERGFPGARRFRAYLKHSIRYVLDEPMVDRVLNPANPTRLVVCVTHLTKRSGKSITRQDMRRLFFQSLTRRWPVKYISSDYICRPVLFDSRGADITPGVKQLTPQNFRRALMASCLIPLAMGMPVQYDGMDVIDGGFSLKLALDVPSGAVYAGLAGALRSAKTLVITPNPEGTLWETSMRIRRWNDRWDVQQAMREGALLIIHPGRRLRAGMLCRNNRLIMETFWQGVERAEQVLTSDRGKRFFGV